MDFLPLPIFKQIIKELKESEIESIAQNPFDKKSRLNYMLVNKKWLKTIRAIYYPKYAFCYAAINGDYETFTYLMNEERVDPSVMCDKAIQAACINNHLMIVKDLLKDKRVNPCTLNRLALRGACMNGHSDVVKELLKDERVDPSIYQNEPLILASQNGHSKVVKELLKDERVDPSCNNNSLVYSAYNNKNYDVLYELLKSDKINHVVKDNINIKLLRIGVSSIKPQKNKPIVKEFQASMSYLEIFLKTLISLSPVYDGFWSSRGLGGRIYA